MIVQVVFGHKRFSAYLTDKRFQTLVHNPEKGEL
jgi:hypothetical protein